VHNAGGKLKRNQKRKLRTIVASVAAGCTALESSRLKRQKGGTLVEFALVVILLLTMFFGIAGFGHALYAYHFVSNVAREATRWAIVNGSTCATDSSCTAPATPTDIDTFVKNHAPEGIDPSKISTVVTFNPAGSNPPAICATAGNADAPGCTVEVTVNYNFKFIFPFIRSTPLPMSSTSQMVIAH
jgi:Flp pilus assembly protein TadG